MENGNQPIVTLTSGQTLHLLKVKLFDEVGISEVAELKAKAARVLGPSGLGLGVFGTPNWEFAAEAAAMAAATSIISGVLSGIQRQSALEALSEAKTKFAAVRASAQMFDCKDLDNISIPHPAAWVGVGEATNQLVSIAHIENRDEKKEFVAKHGFEEVNGRKYNWFTDGNTVVLKWPKRYVFDNDDFVRAVTGSGEVSIRWSEVSTYALCDA
jgi:hypothetical protein